VYAVVPACSKVLYCAQSLNISGDLEKSIPHAEIGTHFFFLDSLLSVVFYHPWVLEFFSP
jgi:hypothetical protein